jgi:hypothetical protein
LKYLFYLHSAACIEACEGIIDYEGIDLKNVVALNARGLKGISERLNQVVINDDLDKFPFYTHRNLSSFRFLQSNRYIQKWDEIVENQVKGEFILYAQNGRHYKYNVLMTNEKCSAVHYFEDGVDFYFTKQQFVKKYPDPLKIRYKIVNFILGKLLGNYNRIRQYDRVFRNLTKHDGIFYGFSKLSGRKFIDFFTERRILPLKLVVSSFLLRSNVVFCFSALSEQRIVDNQTMMQAYEQWWSKNDECDQIALKFHPAQTNASRDFIRLYLLDLGIDVEVIPDDIRMETLFKSNDFSAQVVSCGSSLLMYALLMNSRITLHAIYPIIEKFSGRTNRSSQWNDSFENINDNRFMIWR